MADLRLSELSSRLNEAVARAESIVFDSCRPGASDVVFDGIGARWSVRSRSATRDALLERLAAEHRATEVVCLVSSDAGRPRHVRPGGAEALRRRAFLDDLEPASHEEPSSSRVGDRVDDETRARARAPAAGNED